MDEIRQIGYVGLGRKGSTVKHPSYPTPKTRQKIRNAWILELIGAISQLPMNMTGK